MPGFERYKGGRKPPHNPVEHPRLWIDPFLTGVALPEAAPGQRVAIDYFSKVGTWPMDLNGPDPSNPAGMEGGAGTCGIAGMDHLQMAWNAYAQDSCESWGNETVLQLYEQLGGYVRGDESTDQGTVLQDNLDFWRKEGVNGEKILFFGSLHPGSWLRPERQLALQAFGGLYLGLNLPQSAEEQFPEPWTYRRGSPFVGRHCVTQHGELIGRNEVKLGSWAKIVPASQNFLLHTVEEAWVAAHPDFIEANGRNPSGIDLEGINEALASLTRTSNPLKLRHIL